ncbi:hypothetical protein SSRV2_ORF8 [Saccharolobus shibatae rod virus 2]|nr:hypothetical protein SSRV2_ORF8 [Saccharolobus shibatae rod virus 2]
MINSFFHLLLTLFITTLKTNYLSKFSILAFNCLFAFLVVFSQICCTLQYCFCITSSFCINSFTFDKSLHTSDFLVYPLFAKNTAILRPIPLT